MLDLAARWDARLADPPPGRRASARNLLHYLALRQQDVRPLHRPTTSETPEPPGPSPGLNRAVTRAGYNPAAAAR
jgi:hypothetical protein